MTILFHTADTSLYQLISCYFNLYDYKVVTSMKPIDILQKIDRQKFSAIVVGSESEVFIDQLLYALSQKDSLNLGTPLILLNDKSHNIQVEESLSPAIKAIIDLPFTLSGIHKSLISALPANQKSPTS